MEVRRATLGDAALLAELGASTFFETFAAENTEENMTLYLQTSFSHEQQARELADPQSIFLIAEINGSAAGYAKLNAVNPPQCVTGRKPIELARLYVRKEWLGCGVGAALMQSCLEEAKALENETMWLGVWERNTSAQQFYRRWGFSVVGKNTFMVGADPQKDLLMERGL